MEEKKQWTTIALAISLPAALVFFIGNAYLLVDNNNLSNKNYHQLEKIDSLKQVTLQLLNELEHVKTSLYKEEAYSQRLDRTLMDTINELQILKRRMKLHEGNISLKKPK